MSEGRVRPQRTCLGCRQVRDQSRLVRYVCAPDGAVLVDYREKLPGRGAYTCLALECMKLAVSRRQFDRAFRQSCQPLTAEGLHARLVEELRARMVSLLGMARKSSQVLSGSSQVLDALDRPERLAVVILADDVSSGIAEKVLRKARACEVPSLRFSTKVGLGSALGREERSVTALTRGPLAEAFLAEWQKYLEISGEI